MATLTRYTTFKSLKQNSTAKRGKAVTAKKAAEAEVKAFIRLINKSKAKK